MASRILSCLIHISLFLKYLGLIAVSSNKCVFGYDSNHVEHIEGSSRRVLFLHIGKAGGGTITDIIYHNNLDDKIEIWHPQGKLSEDMFQYYDHIIINVRDPIDRAISAINFECLSSKSKIGSSIDRCNDIKSKDKRFKICKEKVQISDFFKGSPNLIGEALNSNSISNSNSNNINSLNKKDKAEFLLSEFVHTKMSITEHVGGISILQKLLSLKKNIYLIVLGEHFIDQILYQLKSVLLNIANENNKNNKEKENDIKLANNLIIPSHLNKMHLSRSNYTNISLSAQHGFAKHYYEDFSTIGYLNEIGGCNNNIVCKTNVYHILQRWINLLK